MTLITQGADSHPTINPTMAEVENSERASAKELSAFDQLQESPVQRRIKEQRRLQQQKRRAKAAALRKSIEKCRRTSNYILPRPPPPPPRSKNLRLAKERNLPTTYDQYVSLLDELRKHPNDFEQQSSILEKSGRVRWIRQHPWGFEGQTVEVASDRTTLHYVLQIRSE